MHENKLTVIINKPIKEVFEFTTNPDNTHLWVPFVDEEIADKFSPTIGTLYKSRRKESWNTSKVTKYIPNKLFKLENAIFSVTYLYEEMDADITKLTYLESVKKGKLTNSFTKEVLQKLKSIIESD